MKSFYLASAAAGALAGLASPAFAQEAAAPAAETSSADIVVTATRREERLQSVPLAVTALSAQTLNNRGINSVADLGTGKVPGLAVNSLFGSETALGLSIRGFAPNDASQGTLDLPVAFYIDGLNFARSQGAGMELITPERIEVLRGPQGQLFGRNAEAGAVQIISKRPTGELGGDFKVTAGDYGLFAAKGRLELPEIAGFKVQLSGLFKRHEGYRANVRNRNLENVTPPVDPASSFRFPQGNYDGDFQALKTYGGRVAVSRDFGALNAFYSYDNTYAKDDQGMPSLALSPARGTSFNPAGVTGPLSFSNLSGPGGTTYTFVQPVLGDSHPGDLTYSLPNLGFTTKSEGHLLNLTYPLNDSVTVKSITGTRKVIRYGGSVSPALVSPFLPSAYEFMRSKTFSQELQLIYSSDALTFTGGAIYFKENVVDERTSGLVSNCRTSATASAACVPGSSTASTNVYSLSGFKRSLSNSEAFGVYGQATYKIAGFELTAGLRYTNDLKVGQRVIDRALGIDIYNGIGTAIRNRYKTNRFDPAFTVKYNFTDDINAYVRYAVGYRAGGSNVRSNAFGAYNEDELKSWEVGLKSQFLDRRVTFNAAGFINTVKNDIINIQTALPNNPSITDSFNSPVQRKIKGIELELSVRAAPGLTISGNYTYLHSNQPIYGYDPVTLKIFAIDGATYSPTTGLVLPQAVVAAHPGSRTIVQGPMGTPKHAGSINLDYEHPFAEGRIVFHADWTRTSNYLTGSPSIYVTDINAAGTTQTVVPNYNPGVSTNLTNARIAYADFPIAGAAKGELALWVKNAFNRASPTYAFNSGINGSVFVGAPRTMGVDLRVTF